MALVGFVSWGKWMLKHMKGYFDTGVGDASSEQEDLPENRAGNGVCCI